MEYVIGAVCAIVGFLIGVLIAHKKRPKNDSFPVGSENSRAAYDLALAIRDTVEYIGNDLLPAKDGWSWYDALKRHEPNMAKYFVDHPFYFTDSKVFTALDKEDA